jgi:hypothetical protein
LKPGAGQAVTGGDAPNCGDHRALYVNCCPGKEIIDLRYQARDREADIADLRRQLREAKAEINRLTEQYRMYALVGYDASAATREEAIAAKLKELGWVCPTEAASLRSALARWHEVKP